MKDIYELSVQGIVQGVGFRPFIKRLARSFSLSGFVYNTSSGVTIQIKSDKDELNGFLSQMRENAPVLAHILSVEVKTVDNSSYDFQDEKFEIISSTGKSGVTLVSPDIAICDDCLEEILDRDEKRYDYPFTNCTNCGPRYSIMLSLPYDRINTTMESFKMCDSCRKEYSDINDRRFHAQPIACPECGPKLKLNHKGQYFYENEALKIAAKAIDEGQIVAIKGLGGYQLVCDAKNDDTIAKLRKLKNRATKPLAVMCASIKSIDKYIKLDDKYRRLINSTQSPIVIFDWKAHPLSNLINPTCDKIGVMRAYTPLHVLLFKYMRCEFIVATSGNAKDEPIAKDEIEAEENLKLFTDVFLHHDRPINNRVDDSVLVAYGSSYTLLRRARGFAPFPVIIKSSKDEEVLATGANLKSSIALYKGGFAFLSQYIGDLDNIYAEEFYNETINAMKRLFDIKPSVVLRDIHPTYRSSIYAESLGIKTVEIQHHEAHFCSCLAENSFYGDAIGVVLDGFGLGADKQSAWGGEFFVKLGDTLSREAHLSPMIQPGLDSSAKNPYRMVVSYLYSAGLLEKYSSYIKEIFGIDDNEISLLKYMIDSKTNSIYTTSAGRLCEAVGSLVFKKRSNEYEGSLAIDLENIIDKSERGSYKCDIGADNIVDISLLFQYIVEDILSGKSIGVISAQFHNWFSDAIVKMTKLLCDRFDIKNVALSGGVFQNIHLLESVKCMLEAHQISVLTHKKVPANDAGIALGQLYHYLCGLKSKNK